MAYWVYIVRCSDDSFHTGRTTNVERRVSEHNLGIGSEYTMRRRPVRLEFFSRFESEQEAHIAGRQIKGWTRAKKEALIAGDFELLVELSKSGRKAAEEPSPRHPSTGLRR